MLLGLQVRNLRFLSWFFHNDFFFYTMACLSCFTICYLCVRPMDKPALSDDGD